MSTTKVSVIGLAAFNIPLCLSRNKETHTVAPHRSLSVGQAEAIIACHFAKAATYAAHSGATFLNPFNAVV